MLSVTLSCIVLSFLLAGDLPVFAAPVRVRVEIVGEDPAAAKVPVRLVAIRESEAADSAKSVEAAAPGPVSLDLEPGTWSLTAEADGFWSRPAVRIVGEEDVEVRLELWPTGGLAGTLRATAQETLPEAVEIHFRSVAGKHGELREKPPRARSPEVPPSYVTCEVVTDAWRCDVPAGTLDVQVAAAGFVKQFRWDVEVQPGEVTRLGTIEVRRGSSVHGWVSTEDGSALEGVRISLTPRAVGRRPDDSATARRLAVMAVSTVANHRGFFQLEAAPGDYVLGASKAPFAPARATVRVLADEATVVDDPPLTLSYPRTLEIYVDPPTAPGNGLWNAKLVQVDTYHNVMENFDQGTIGADGSWRVEGVPAGRFYLSLATVSGENWFHQSLVVDSDLGPVFVHVPVVEVRGRVRLGSDPLEARMTFGGKYGAQSVVLASNEDGEFSGLLPRPGSWNVEVEADDPAVRRSVQQEIDEDEEIDIALPDTSVRGQVVDEAGMSVGRAMVRVRNLDQPTMSADLRADGEGRFASAGLPAGRTVFMAESMDRSSEPREVLLEEDRATPDLRLVVRRNRKLSGRVVSQVGGVRTGGVPGAKITAIPVHALSLGSPIVATDAAGDFEIGVPPGTRELILTVAAPGFAFRTLRRVAEEPLILPVQETGGTLILELPESLDLNEWDSPRVAIFHGGGLVGIYSLRSWAAFHAPASVSESAEVIPRMEPGRYLACLARFTELAALLAGVDPGAPCVGGELIGSGELRLSLRGAPEKY